MTTLALLLLLAALGHAVARWAAIPVIPVLLGLGMAASFGGWLVAPGGPDAGHQDPLRLILELGLVVLVFASGMELNPDRFRRQRRAVIWVGIAQFAVMGLVGNLAARALGLGARESAYLGLAVSASSTLVVLSQLQATQRAVEPHGRLVIGVLLLQDALTLSLLVILTHSSGGLRELAAGIGSTALMAAAAWLAQRHLAPRWVARCGQDDEALLLGMLSVLFAFLGAAHFAGLPLVVGAFLAGYSLSRFPVSGVLAGQMLSMVDFFRALFFVGVGALAAVPGPQAMATALLLSALVVLVTPPAVVAIAEWTGMNTRAAIECGLLLAQTSEFSIVLALLGHRLGHLSSETFTVIVLMTVITMTLTPFLARESVARHLLRWHPLQRKRATTPSRLSGHALIIGLGSAGMWVLRPLQAAGMTVLVVDDDPQVISDLDRKGIPCLRGDGSDADTLERAGARHARFVVASMRRAGDAHAVIAAAPGVPVLARVFEDGEAEAVRRLGGIPVSSAEAAAAEFMKWFRHS